MLETHASLEQSRENETQDTSLEASQESSSVDSNTQADTEAQVAQALFELDKHEKFKFDGQEWTLKDLKESILRHKDYTQKTQQLSQERKAFDEDRKFHVNLHADLAHVRANPALAQEFIRTYPASFHQYLKPILASNSMAQQTQTQPKPQQPVAPQLDVETMSRLDRFEKFVHEQEVAKQKSEIDSTVSEMSKKYPDAIPELAVAKMHDAHLSGQKITKEMWDQAFKESDEQVKGLVKKNYGELVKQQTQANKRAKDVSAGGGTPGRAPTKFKSLKEVTEHAVKSLTER